MHFRMLVWQQAVDFVVLAIAFYLVLAWARRARALRLALGVLVLEILGFIGRSFGMIISGWVLNVSGLILALLLLLLFQAEIRRVLMRLDGLLHRSPENPVAAGFPRLAEAVFEFAGERIGALVVIPRRDTVDELLAAATPLSAPVTREMLRAIFQPTSPLHDGAAVVDQGRVTAVNAVLPLTRRTDLPPQYGTRHRAAIGLTEYCDALVVVVSEERGEVRLVNRGSLRLIPSAAGLNQALNAATKREAPLPRSRRIARWIVGNWHIKAAAISLSAVVWLLTIVVPTTTIRVLLTPIEFTNVPAGLEIADQSALRIQVELRGSAWLVDSLNPATVIARLDLSGARRGLSTVRVTPRAFNLAPGIVAERIDPPQVRVRLEPASP